MRQELNDKLCKDHPNVFRTHNTNIGFAFPGDGWYHLIDACATEVDRVKKITGIQFIAIEVKEKFGELRFYIQDDGRATRHTTTFIRNVTDELWQFIMKYEIMSRNVCEKCGASGMLRTGSWRKTLCNDCADGKLAI